MRKNYTKTFYDLHLDIVNSILSMMRKRKVTDVDLSDDKPTIYGDILSTGDIQTLIVHKVSVSNKGELMLDVTSYYDDDNEIETVSAMNPEHVFRCEGFASVYDAVYGRLFE